MRTFALKQMLWQRLAAASFALVCTLAHADPVTFGGSVADPNNPALMGSGSEPSTPSFGNPSDVANNVAVYSLTVPFGGFTDFNFGGFSDFTFSPLFQTSDASSGLQPYLSLFRGTGASATFFAASGGLPDRSFDPDLRVFLTAGSYMIAISNMTNQSIAQLRQGGTLGQGFSGRGDPALVGNGSYRLTVALPSAIPEPEALWLLSIGVAALLLHRRQRRRSVRAANGD